MNKIKLSEARCTSLSFGATVSLAKDESKITGFELDGYTGAAVDRLWGKLVIDLSGIEAKQKMPVFRDHNPSEIVGYSTKTDAGDSFKVMGVFSKTTETAREVIGLAEEGFPWQASIGVKPSIITEIKEGVTFEVNGQAINGPAEVWTESEVFETSFVPLGADGNTSATVFSKIEETDRAILPTKREGKNMNLQELKDQHPDLVAEIVKEDSARQKGELRTAREAGASAELERIKSVHAQMYPGQESLVAAAMFDGKSEAGEVAMKINEANLKAQKEAAEKLSGEAPKAVAEQGHSGELSGGEMTEEKAKSVWDKDVKLQKEFFSFEDYLAYTKDDPRLNVVSEGGVK